MIFDRTPHRRSAIEAPWARSGFGVADDDYQRRVLRRSRRASWWRRAAWSRLGTNFGPGTIPVARFDYNERITQNLFSLRSAQSHAAGPLLTVPAGQ